MGYSEMIDFLISFGLAFALGLFFGISFALCLKDSGKDGKDGGAE